MDKENDEVKFSIEGNPGQNNTFVHIGRAIHVNNNPQKVESTIIISADGEEWNEAALREAGVDVPEKKSVEVKDSKKVSNMDYRQMLEEGIIDKSRLQRDIMKYVDAICDYVKDDKNDLFLKLWKRILEHRAFAIELYDPGKQDSKYNRDLVGNIMHYLNEKGFYKAPYNQSEMTRAVALKIYGTDNKGADDPARRGLRGDLEKRFSKVVDEILEELKEKKQ